MPKCRPGFFSTSPIHHYNKPILDIHHRISPPSPFFLFPVKKFAKGTLLCLRSRPANTMMLYDDKGGLSFYPDLFSMKWDQPWKREGGLNSGLFASEKNPIRGFGAQCPLCMRYYGMGTIIWSVPPPFGYASTKKQPLQAWLLLANILDEQLASLLTYKKSGTLMIMMSVLFCILMQ